MDRVVIVGAGLAGGRSAVELRRQGYAGRITLIGAEPYPPYDRPPLSKAVLDGRTEGTTLPLDLGDVELVTGRRATGLRPGRVETDGGPLEFDALVVATGATPVTLPGGGPQRVLRTIDDALALRAALKPGVRVVVVGAGWIGAEVATAAAKAGAEAIVVEAGVAPLAQALGAAVGAHTAAWYERAGVALRLGVAVEAVRPGGLELRGGEWLPADEVVVGVGVRPAVGWLGGALALADGGGVAVDEHLSASWQPPVADGPTVVAVGDCAAWWSRRYGARLRVEHWDNAQHAPEAAASTLLARLPPGRVRPDRGGLPAAPQAFVPASPGSAAPVYDPVPYFWSQQFDHMIQFAGHRGGGEDVVWRGSAAAGDERGPRGRPVGWAVGWFAADGRLAALATVDRPLDMAQGRKLIKAAAKPDPARFADLGVALKALL